VGGCSPPRRLPEGQEVTHTEKYERHAEAFYSQTGFMAPGKSVPLEMSADQPYEIRLEAWTLWMGRPQEDCPACNAKDKK